MKRQLFAGLALVAAGALALTGCSQDTEPNDTPETTESAETSESYSIGINQLVQHAALDAATEGFQQAFADADLDVEFDVQNANGEQSTAVTIAQSFASQDLDLVLAVATPAAQASAAAITDIPVLFTAVTDAEEAQLVDSNDAPGGNVTGVSDMAPIEDQFELLLDIGPDAKSVGIVYASGEVNSQVQVDAAQEVADELGLEIVTKTVAAANEIQQATEALGDVDAIYVPTDNRVVEGISALVQVAETKQIPVIAAEAGTVEGGAIATIGIDYFKLGYQTGEMAIRILEGDDAASTPVEFANEFSDLVNTGAAERMGVTVPDAILEQADTIE